MISGIPTASPVADCCRTKGGVEIPLIRGISPNTPFRITPLFRNKILEIPGLFRITPLVSQLRSTRGGLLQEIPWLAKLDHKEIPAGANHEGNFEIWVPKKVLRRDMLNRSVTIKSDTYFSFLLTFSRWPDNDMHSKSRNISFELSRRFWKLEMSTLYGVYIYII